MIKGDSEDPLKGALEFPNICLIWPYIPFKKALQFPLKPLDYILRLQASFWILLVMVLLLGCSTALIFLACRRWRQKAGEFLGGPRVPFKGPLSRAHIYNIDRYMNICIYIYVRVSREREREKCRCGYRFRYGCFRKLRVLSKGLQGSFYSSLQHVGTWM